MNAGTRTTRGVILPALARELGERVGRLLVARAAGLALGGVVGGAVIASGLVAVGRRPLGARGGRSRDRRGGRAQPLRRGSSFSSSPPHPARTQHDAPRDPPPTILRTAGRSVLSWRCAMSRPWTHGNRVIGLDLRPPPGVDSWASGSTTAPRACCSPLLGTALWRTTGRTARSGSAAAAGYCLEPEKSRPAPASPRWSDAGPLLDVRLERLGVGLDRREGVVVARDHRRRADELRRPAASSRSIV